MSLAELIVTMTFALVAAAALMTAHASIKANRTARRETRQTWTVTPASEVYDWAAAEAELSDGGR